jgi:chromosome segregation ATPase
MVEILEPSGGGKNGNNADSFRDLLAPSDQKPTSIHLRHHDMKGAVIEGLCEVEIDSMPALLEALARTRQRRAQRRKGKNSTAVTATAVIGTLLYWEHAVSYELNKPPNATVTCAELASNQSITPSSDGHTSSDSEKLESITQRKSVVSLGQAMRQLLLQQAHGYEKALGLSTSELAPVVSYRETTLTKVLQRSMESSKIVLVASISPLSRNYENTVFTLNYLRRLLVKPGSTLTSPFGGRNNKGTPKTAKTDNRTNQTINSTNTSIINRTVLSSPEAMESKEKLKIISNDPKYIEQLVSDPRQRLARLFGISPPRNKKSKPWSNVLDRMEGSQKSTRGTLTAIRVTGPDTSTLSSNSARASPGLPNSYTGPQEEETRQVVESPGSTQQNGQPRQSWQTEEDEDDGGVHDYQIPFVGDGLDSNIIDGGSNEWDSEEEIERELLMSARKKERTLQKEIEEIEETISYDEDGEEENDGENGDAENEAIEVDLQGVHGEGFAPGAKDAGNTSGQALQEIVPEGSYYDDEDAEDNQEPLEYAMPEESNQGDPPGDQIADVIPSAPTDVTNMIRNQLEEEFAPMDDDVGGNSVENGDEYDGDETLGLQPITVETVGNDESLTEVDDNRQTLFTDEEWQTQEGTEASILGLKPIEVVEPPLNAFSGVLDLDPNHAEEDSTDGRNQTNYDLPDDPLPVRDSVDRVNIQSSPLSSPYHSPFQQRQAFNTHASPYSVRLKTAKSREYVELTNEREELRTTVTRLREDLRKVTEERDTNIEQYEIQIQKLNGNLNEAAEAKRELETVASQAITARTSSAQEMENYVEEREQLQRTVNQLRRDLERVSETQEDQLHRHRAEIDEFQLKLSRAMATQKEIEGIADEAVTAHKNQVEETRVLTAEREELHVTMAELQNTMQSLETDQGYNVTKYQQEIRQLHARLEETMKDKRHLQQETDDARFKLETQSEKLRLMNLEREELNATLSSVKGTAKKALGDHDEYTRRFKNEIQQLHVKLDDAHSDKLKVEKAADEIRFAKDDLERRVQSLEEELASSRANTLRLEGIRREEQDTIRKMNTQLRRKESEKIDMEHFRNELERLKRHKDDLEGLVAHRKLESSASLKELEKELADSKRKNLNLEDGFHSIRMELSSSQKEKGELAEKLRSAYEATSQLSHKLGERGESIERLQSSYDHLESLRSTDQDVIAKLKEKLRNTESAALDVEQLNHKLSRLRQDRDYLYQQMESRKDEYERSMEEKSNEVSAYANQVESLKQDLKKVSSMDSTYRTDAEAQLRSLQASEDNLVRNLRQRDAEIAKLRDELAIRTDEINSLHRKEASTSNAEREVTRLQERLAKLEVTLDITTKEREDAVQKARSESSSQRSMLEELERARGEVHHLRNSLRDLNKELDERQEESLKAKERIFHMESTLREFKKEAKDRVNSLADREIDSHNILERTRHANRDLTNNLQSLNSIVERLRRERDMCFESLQDGQKKLSELSSRKDYVMPLDDLLTTPSYQRRLRSPRRREPRTAPRNSHPPVESVTARVSNRLVPEIYVSSYNLASPSTLAEERAEEIAACVAQNAKESLEENFEEVSQLRSQIYRLEDERSEQVTHLKAKVRSLENDLSYERVGCRNMKDEKSEQISSLRAKVRNLEKELSYDRLGNRTPVMGSTSQRSRKQNYFVDWDEKQSY